MTRIGCALVLVLAAACSGGDEPRRAEPAPSRSVATDTSPQPTTAPAPAPPLRPHSWQAAGAFVWHETDVDPTTLGAALRENGFGWVAVRVHDGLTEDAVDGSWIERFRAASGLPVGGWGVLRDRPEREADLAAAIVARDRLDFYVANAEAEYLYSGPGGPDATRFRRAELFVDAFRGLLPQLPAGVTSYCRSDRHDMNWRAWRRADFVFFPQAYVNDFGSAAAPARCAAGARGVFPAADVHPLIGMYVGVKAKETATTYARLLAEASTVGFAVYLAETTTLDEWRVLGAAIHARGIAR